jgi:O-succinylbenzoate synthase
VDANGAYGEGDAAHLAELDRFGLLCVEQPFDPPGLEAHARLARRISTPVCLDESLDSPATVERALALGACSVVCVKPARLGGLGAALQVIETCAGSGVPLWMGGMFESGYARGVNTTLAALPGFSWPGDLSPTRTYLGDDVVPGPRLSRSGPDGSLVARVPDGEGMGPPPDADSLLRLGAVSLRIEGP